MRALRVPMRILPSIIWWTKWTPRSDKFFPMSENRWSVSRRRPEQETHLMVKESYLMVWEKPFIRSWSEILVYFALFHCTLVWIFMLCAALSGDFTRLGLPLQVLLSRSSRCFGAWWPQANDAHILNWNSDMIYLIRAFVFHIGFDFRIGVRRQIFRRPLRSVQMSCGNCGHLKCLIEFF